MGVCVLWSYLLVFGKIETRKIKIIFVKVMKQDNTSFVPVTYIYVGARISFYSHATTRLAYMYI